LRARVVKENEQQQKQVRLQLHQPKFVGFELLHAREHFLAFVLRQRHLEVGPLGLGGDSHCDAEHFVDWVNLNPRVIQTRERDPSAALFYSRHVAEVDLCQGSRRQRRATDVHAHDTKE
jgi:hypothetical protein